MEKLLSFSGTSKLGLKRPSRDSCASKLRLDRGVVTQVVLKVLEAHVAISVRSNGGSAEVKELVGKITVTTMPFKQVLQEQPKFVQVQIVAVIPIISTPQLLAVVRQTLEPELWVESYLAGLFEADILHGCVGERKWPIALSAVKGLILTQELLTTERPGSNTEVGGGLHLRQSANLGV